MQHLAHRSTESMAIDGWSPSFIIIKLFSKQLQCFCGKNCIQCQASQYPVLLIIDIDLLIDYFQLNKIRNEIMAQPIMCTVKWTGQVKEEKCKVKIENWPKSNNLGKNGKINGEKWFRKKNGMRWTLPAKPNRAILVVNQSGEMKRVKKKANKNLQLPRSRMPSKANALKVKIIKTKLTRTE